MEIIPELLILNGRVVSMERGDIALAADMGDPEELARRYAAAGAPRVHVVDVSGALSGEPAHLPLVERLSAILPVQYGGGLRTAAQIDAAVASGVHRIVLGSAAVDDPDLLTRVPSERLVVSLDIRDGVLSVHGRDDSATADPALFAAELAASGVERILCTPVGRDGTRSGPDLRTLVSVSMCGALVLAHGGVSELHDLREIARLPAIEGIVVGSALHTGAFTYAAAAKALVGAD